MPSYRSPIFSINARVNEGPRPRRSKIVVDRPSMSRIGRDSSPRQRVPLCRGARPPTHQPRCRILFPSRDGNSNPRRPPRFLHGHHGRDQRGEFPQVREARNRSPVEMRPRRRRARNSCCRPGIRFPTTARPPNCRSCQRPLEHENLVRTSADDDARPVFGSTQKIESAPAIEASEKTLQARRESLTGELCATERIIDHVLDTSVRAWIRLWLPKLDGDL